MAKSILSGLTTDKIAKMSREELIRTNLTGGNTIARRIRNLEKSGITSPFLERRKKNGTLPKEYKRPQLEKKSNTELRKIAIDLVRVDQAKTSGVRKAKKFLKDFKKKTGVDYNSISEDDWEETRDAIEVYGSEEVFEVYKQGGDLVKDIASKEREKVNEKFKDVTLKEIDLEKTLKW